MNDNNKYHQKFHIKIEKHSDKSNKQTFQQQQKYLH